MLLNWQLDKKVIDFLDTLDLKTIIKTCPSTEIYEVMGYIEGEYQHIFVNMYKLNETECIFDNFSADDFEDYLEKRYEDCDVEYVERRYILFPNG